MFRLRLCFRNFIGCKYWVVESFKDLEYVREVEFKKFYFILKEYGMIINRIIDFNFGIFYCYFFR